MTYPIEFTDEFEQWWNGLDIKEQKSVAYSVRLLGEAGFNLQRPHADVIHGSKISNLKELRCQHEGRPYRILFVFDQDASLSYCSVVTKRETQSGMKPWSRKPKKSTNNISKRLHKG